MQTGEQPLMDFTFLQHGRARGCPGNRRSKPGNAYLAQYGHSFTSN